MPARTLYPTPADLAAYLGRMEIPAPKIEAQDLECALDGAVEYWMKATGYNPFLSDGTQTLIRFRAPRSITLEFGMGFVSVDEVRIEGSILVEGTDYELRPWGADRRGEPWTELKLLRRFWTRSVLVLGVPGYNSTLPEMVWKAILVGAALSLAPQLGAALQATEAKEGGEVKKRATGDTTIEYEVASAATSTKFTRELAGMQAFYEEILNAHTLRVFGL